MSTVYTNDLRIRNAKNLVESLVGTPDSSYLFVGKNSPWDNDSVPPAPSNNTKEYYEVQEEIISLKRIIPDDVSFMIRRYNYVSGTIYDIYRHDYNNELRSYNGASNLYDAKWCVLSSNRCVYACLNNNNNQVSTIEPLVDRSEPFINSDGYQWLKLFKLTTSEFADKITKNYLPVSNNEKIIEKDGVVYTIVIDNPGSLFTTSPDGTDQRINYYYTRIYGDGRDGIARIEVELGRVVDIEVVEFGYGYTNAEIRFEYGYVYGSVRDLLNDRNPLNPLGDGSFRSTVIIGPVGGWGQDITRQIGATRVGVLSKLKFDSNDFHNQTTYRQVGILKSPQNSGNKSTLTGTYGIKLTNSNTTFVPGDVIEQINDLEQVAKGRVISFDESNSVIRYIQNTNEHLDDKGNLNLFGGSNDIFCGQKRGTIDPINNEIGGLNFDMGYSLPEYEKYTGELIYLNNISPIERSATQNEKLNIIISY